jgi:hypothetical protein
MERDVSCRDSPGRRLHGIIVLEYFWCLSRSRHGGGPSLCLCSPAWPLAAAALGTGSSNWRKRGAAAGPRLFCSRPPGQPVWSSRFDLLVIWRARRPSSGSQPRPLPPGPQPPTPTTHAHMPSACGRERAGRATRMDLNPLEAPAAAAFVVTAIPSKPGVPAEGCARCEWVLANN